MKQLWQYIKNPLEYCSYDFSIRTMLSSAILCLFGGNGPRLTPEKIANERGKEGYDLLETDYR